MRVHSTKILLLFALFLSRSEKLHWACVGSIEQQKNRKNKQSAIDLFVSNELYPLRHKLLLYIYPKKKIITCFNVQCVYDVCVCAYVRMRECMLSKNKQFDNAILIQKFYRMQILKLFLPLIVPECRIPIFYCSIIFQIVKIIAMNSITNVHFGQCRGYHHLFLLFF